MHLVRIRVQVLYGDANADRCKPMLIQTERRQEERRRSIGKMDGLPKEATTVEFARAEHSCRGRDLLEVGCP